MTFTPSTEDTTTDTLNICTSLINYIPIYLFLPLINDAYYYSDDSSSTYSTSSEITGYKDLFFYESIKIITVGNLITDDSSKKNEDRVKMIQYDDTKGEKALTILSIIKMIYI